MGRPSSRDPRNVSKTVVKQPSTAEFQLLHLSVLREYLDMDICLGLRQEKATTRLINCPHTTLSHCFSQMSVSLERVIDDFVFMTFLVGNDFLPHLPSLDIAEGAFDRLFSIYRAQVRYYLLSFFTICPHSRLLPLVLLLN